MNINTHPLGDGEAITSFQRYQDIAATTAIYPFRLRAVDASETIAARAPDTVVSVPPNNDMDIHFNTLRNYIGLSYPFIGLAGESGELVGKIKKVCRDGKCALTFEAREKLAGVGRLPLVCRRVRLSFRAHSF